MTTRARFLATMAERRRFKRGTLDHDYLTRTARQLAWLARGVPVNEWSHQ